DPGGVIALAILAADVESHPSHAGIVRPLPGQRGELTGSFVRIDQCRPDERAAERILDRRGRGELGQGALEGAVVVALAGTQRWLAPAWIGGGCACGNCA